MATTITPPTAIGEAYTAPSSLIDSITSGMPITSGMDADRPLCEGSPWYIGQSGTALADAVEVGEAEDAGAAAEAGGVEDGAGSAGPSSLPRPARAGRATSRHAGCQPHRELDAPQSIYTTAG